MVELHGGQIDVKSEWEKGSVFTVSIPLGFSHLPQERVIHTFGVAGHSFQTRAFIQEAAGLVDSAPKLAGSSIDNADRPRLLIVDDNADMRAYLSRLLSPLYELDTAIHGLDAMEKMDGFAPDVVISDIMMPVMDGKVLLEKIRANAQWTGTPVIFVSARAGNEAKVEGLEAGADDYLVKPFSATELLSRVRIQINQSRRRELQESIIDQRTFELSQANEHLRRQNDELRQFAFVSSHDLQEPLRKMHYFADRAMYLIADAASLQDVMFPLQKITQSAKRLSTLIADLLAFARIENDHSHKEATDLNIVWEQVREDYDEQIKATGAQIVNGVLPTVYAYPSQMYRLLSNLLSNALKFYSGHPRIQLEGSISGQDMILSFSDQGLGFPQDQADRIFDVFQRLHISGTFDGTGIGLAIVKKIVDRHNGSISVKSEIGQGTTFTVSIPRK